MAYFIGCRTLGTNLDMVVAIGHRLNLEAENQTFGQAVLNTGYGTHTEAENLTGTGVGHIELNTLFIEVFTQIRIHIFTQIRIHYSFTCVWGTRFNSTHLPSQYATDVEVDAFVSCIEVIVRTESHIPGITDTCFHVLIILNRHFGNAMVTFDIVLRRSCIDIHTEHQVYIPVVAQEIFTLNTDKVDQRVRIQFSQTKIDTRITRLIICTWKTYRIIKSQIITPSITIPVSRQQIIHVLIEHLVITDNSRNLPLTFLGSKRRITTAVVLRRKRRNCTYRQE